MKAFFILVRRKITSAKATAIDKSGERKNQRLLITANRKLFQSLQFPFPLHQILIVPLNGFGFFQPLL